MNHRTDKILAHHKLFTQNSLIFRTHNTLKIIDLEPLFCYIEPALEGNFWELIDIKGGRNMRHIILIFVLLVVAITGCGHHNIPVRTYGGNTVQIANNNMSPNIDAKTWTTLVEELFRQLAEKTFSAPPKDSVVHIIDLVVAGNRNGEATLTWTSPALKGDYNNDGKVDISDITPLAMYYGQRFDVRPETIFVNGDDNPIINVADITAIAINFGFHLQGFRVYRGKWDGEVVNWESNFRPNSDLGNPDWSINRIEPVELTTEYVYEDIITSLLDDRLSVTNVRYKVIAYGDNTEGEESNMAIMPDLLPLLAISGVVKEGNGGGITGVVLELLPGGLLTTTDSGGNYAFSLLESGEWVVNARKKNGFWFEKESISVVLSTADALEQDFTARKAGVANSPWPKYQGDVKNSGLGREVGAVTNTLRWQYPVAATGMMFGSPSIGEDGAVYVGANHSLYAINPSGTERWTVPLNPTKPVQTTPVIGNGGYIYIGCGDNRIYAFDNFGELKWASPTESETEMMFSSPTISPGDGTIYVGSTDNSVYALNPADGNVCWIFPTDGDVYASPAIGDDGTIYVGSYDGKLYAINPDGTEKWNFPTDSTGIPTSPAIGEDGSIYFWSFDRNMYALHPDGGLNWRVPIDAFFASSPVVTSDYLYLGVMDDGGNVYSLNPADGSVNWSFPTSDYASSWLSAGVAGTVYVGCSNGTVYALNPNESIKWQYSTGAVIESSPAIGNDIVYIIAEDGFVYAFGNV